MVSVAKIDGTYQNSGVRNSVLPKQTVSFAGKAQAAELAKTLVRETKRFPKFLEWLGQNDGEILNTIVTGIGTAFVAPLFIAFNPFSKEDKDTKIYSAWRQPISAILAVAAQIGINMQYNKHLDLISSTGHFDRADLRAMPAKSYLKSIIKLEHPEYNKKQLANEIEKRQTQARWNAIDEARKKLKDKEISWESTVDNEALRLARKEIKKDFKDELAKLSDKQQEKYIEKLLPERAKIVAQRQVEESGKIKFQVREWIQEAKNKSIDFDALVKEKAKAIEAMAENSEKAFLSKTLVKLKEYKSFDNVKDLGKTLAEVTQNVKIKRMVLANIDRARAVLSSYRRWTGIVISLITLPVSCGLLNYTYPRLMEKIMPHAHKKKMHKYDTPPMPKKLAQGKEVSE